MVGSIALVPLGPALQHTRIPRGITAVTRMAGWPVTAEGDR